ncbi:glyco_transf_28 domain-containing protein [Haematococcus lacustris]|uniref:Glyco_transf_28 domain-containing protein n=1 Tax=Haematococcus lacustris TaxID=44745 RepID=A0A699Y7N9_HAELA|nr:glyco_transf_28 domain-containing protein [Haematococcus lacustris]
MAATVSTFHLTALCHSQHGQLSCRNHYKHYNLYQGVTLVVGFINVELRKLTSYTPPEELRTFLAAGPPPVYIGFGSLVVDDPNELTAMFMSALRRTGLRAIIQRGWGYGPGAMAPPPNVLFIDSAPHDWLFQMSCAVVHHGGAGTTATGLMAGQQNSFNKEQHVDLWIISLSYYKHAVASSVAPLMTTNPTPMARAWGKPPDHWAHHQN